MDSRIAKIGGRLQQISPLDLRSVAGPIYYRYLSLVADRQHEPPTWDSSNDVDPNHVLVLCIDALRPDESPDLPVDFTSAVAPATWTFPSVTSLHTGLYPHEHGATVQVQEGEDTVAMPNQFDTVETLPHSFEAAGFDTYLGAGFINPYLATKGWYQTHRLYGDADAEALLEEYRSWRNQRERTFAYLQLSDLHAPISPPERYIREYDVDGTVSGLSANWDRGHEYDGTEEDEYWRDQRLKLYRAARAYVEDTLEPVFDRFAEDTVIVVTGDHGEAFFEHFRHDENFTLGPHAPGCGHGGTPFDAVARVPLGIHHPKKEIDRSGGHPSLIDLPKTLLEGVGLSGERFGGINLFEDCPVDRAVLCEGVRYGSERKSVYEDYDKIIHSRADEVTLNATVDRRAGESFNELSKDRVVELLDRLPENWNTQEKSNAANPMVEDQLRALGYK